MVRNPVTRLALIAMVCCLGSLNPAFGQQGPHNAMYGQPGPGAPMLQNASQQQPTGMPSYGDLLRRVENLEANARCNSMEGSYCGPYVRVDAVYAKPYFSNNSAYFGQPDNAGSQADESAINVPFAYDFEVSPRIEIGQMCSTRSLGWRARYWHYDASGAAGNHVDVFGDNPDNDAIAINVGARISDIDTFAQGFILHSLKTDVGDLEATKQLRHIVVGAGLRVANFRQRYQFVDVATDEGDMLYAEADSFGFGPTLSVGFNHHIRCSPWSFYGDARVAVLFGDQQIDADSDADIGPFSYNTDSVLWNGEVETGFEWRQPVRQGCQQVFARFGIQGQHWGGIGNLMNTNSSGGDGGSANGALFNGDLGFLGFNAALGLDF